MNEMNPVMNQNDLLIYCRKVRLDADYEIINTKLDANKKVEGEHLSFKERMNNFLKDAKTSAGDYENKKKKIEENIASFNEKNPCVMSGEAAKDMMKDLFKEDQYGLAKLLFSISVISDNEVKFFYEDEGLKKVSLALFDDENELINTKKAFNESYKAIAPGSLTSTQTGILVGVAVASLAGVLALPALTAGGLATAGIISGGIAVAGLGTLTAEALLFAAALTGAVYGGMKLYNSEKMKQEFRTLTPEKESVYLAIQCVYIERIKKTLSEEEFKEQLDSILKSMNTLKGDLDYFYLVEKEDTKNNKAKMETFHRFDNRLVKILGL